MSRRVALVIVLLFAAFGAARAAVSKSVPGDFLRYHRAGRMVATGLAEKLYDVPYLRGQHVYAAERVPGEDLEELEFKYAPALAIAMAPIGALPPRAANIVWGAWNAALIAWMFVVVWSWCGAGVSPWWLVPPGLVLLRVANDNMNLGQLNPSAIVPATVGLVLVHRGSARTGGALLGFGTVVKFMPGVVVLWLAWKRAWKALAAALGVVLLMGLALPAVVLGPSRAVDAHRAWLDARAHHFTQAKAPDLPGHSIKSFVYRTLGDTPYVTGKGGKEVRVRVGAGALAPEQLRTLVLVLDVLVLAAVFWFTRGALRGGDDPRGPPEAALALAALPLVSPEARYPHLLFLTLPLLALTCALVRDRGRSRVALALGVVGALLVNSNAEKVVGRSFSLTADIYCLPGWGVLLICAALALLLRGLRARQTLVS